MKKIMLICFLSFIFPGARAQDFAQYEKKEFTRNDRTLKYRILYPSGYDARKTYPLVVFLHGAGQWGNDNETQLKHAGTFFLQDSIRKNHPAIIILPQCPRGSSWSFFQFKWNTQLKKLAFSFPFKQQPEIYSLLVKQLADSLLDAKLVDQKRVYVGGLSMGGFGTFDMITRYPGYFAAAFAICGGGDTALAAKIAGKTAIWIFHGDADPVVNVEYSRNYVHALQKMHADVRYTEYPGVRHNSWDKAFAEKELVTWLFSKKGD